MRVWGYFLQWSTVWQRIRSLRRVIRFVVQGIGMDFTMLAVGLGFLMVSAALVALAPLLQQGD